MAKKIVFSFGKKKDDKKNLKKGLAIGASIGAAFGAISGILFAPKSGKETRQIIKDETINAAKKASDGIKTAVDTTAEKAKDLYAKVKKDKCCEDETCCEDTCCEDEACCQDECCEKEEETPLTDDEVK